MSRLISRHASKREVNMKDKRIIDFFEEYKEKNNCPEYM